MSDWSSDVCSSDLDYRVQLPGVHRCGERIVVGDRRRPAEHRVVARARGPQRLRLVDARGQDEPVAEELTLPREPILAVPRAHREDRRGVEVSGRVFVHLDVAAARGGCIGEGDGRSELQSLMRISYAVFCLKKKKELER